MDFPEDNKIKNKKDNEKDIEDKIESNGKMLEEQLKKFDKPYLIRTYFKLLGYFCVTLFAILTTIKLVFLIFDIFYLWL